MESKLVGPQNDKHYIKYISGAYQTEADEYIKILTKYHKPIYLDVGSNIGYFAVSLASFCEQIHCFEPVSYLYDFLVQNTKHTTNIITNPIAISDSIGQDTITISTKHHQGSTLDHRIIKKFSKIFNEEKTEIIYKTNLASYIERHNIERIHLLKLDCEGLEYKSLLGLKEYLSIVDNIVFESYFRDDISNIQEYASKYGFLMSGFKGIGGPMFLLTKSGGS